LKEQHPGKRLWEDLDLKQVARNTAADNYTAMKEWLATNPDGKLPTNQKAEG
jgi:hypothetical protein